MGSHKVSFQPWIRRSTGGRVSFELIGRLVAFFAPWKAPAAGPAPNRNRILFHAGMATKRP